MGYVACSSALTVLALVPACLFDLDAFNEGDYQASKLAPVFFGSAVNNFGVRPAGTIATLALYKAAEANRAEFPAAADEKAQVRSIRQHEEPLWPGAGYLPN